MSQIQHKIQYINTLWPCGVFQCGQQFCDSNSNCNVSNVPLCLAEVEKFAGLSSCSAQLEENLQDLTGLAHQEHWVHSPPGMGDVTPKHYPRRMLCIKLFDCCPLHTASTGSWIRWLSSGFMTWDLNKVSEWLSSAFVCPYSLHWGNVSPLWVLWGSVLKSFAGFCLWRIYAAGIFPPQFITVCLFSVCVYATGLLLRFVCLPPPPPCHLWGGDLFHLNRWELGLALNLLHLLQDSLSRRAL